MRIPFTEVQQGGVNIVDDGVRLSFLEKIQSRKRAYAGPSAPPDGLCFIGAGYGDDG